MFVIFSLNKDYYRKKMYLSTKCDVCLCFDYQMTGVINKLSFSAGSLSIQQMKNYPNKDLLFLTPLYFQHLD